MKFETYQHLIEHINKHPLPKERLQEIINYFISSVQFDYVMIEHINQIVTPRFANYADKLFPNSTEKFREKAICLMRNSSNISNDYWYRLRKIYLTPSISSNGEVKYPTMLSALNNIEPDVIIHNGLLKKGVAIDIVTFAKQLCTDCNIKALIIEGISSGKMKHYWLNIELDDQELFYDITYAIYVRDNFCGMGARYHYDDWLGINPKQMYKNQATRTILVPNGFNLKELALNNCKLNMKQFFDTSA